MQEKLLTASMEQYSKMIHTAIQLLQAHADTTVASMLGGMMQQMERSMHTQSNRRKVFELVVTNLLEDVLGLAHWLSCHHYEWTTAVMVRMEALVTTGMFHGNQLDEFGDILLNKDQPADAQRSIVSHQKVLFDALQTYAKQYKHTLLAAYGVLVEWFLRASQSKNQLRRSSNDVMTATECLFYQHVMGLITQQLEAPCSDEFQQAALKACCDVLHAVHDHRLYRRTVKGVDQKGFLGVFVQLLQTLSKDEALSALVLSALDHVLALDFSLVETHLHWILPWMMRLPSDTTVQHAVQILAVFAKAQRLFSFIEQFVQAIDAQATSSFLYAPSFLNGIKAHVAALNPDQLMEIGTTVVDTLVKCLAKKAFKRPKLDAYRIAYLTELLCCVLVAQEPPSTLLDACSEHVLNGLMENQHVYSAARLQSVMAFTWPEFLEQAVDADLLLQQSPGDDVRTMLALASLALQKASHTRILDAGTTTKLVDRAVSWLHSNQSTESWNGILLTCTERTFRHASHHLMHEWMSLILQCASQPTRHHVLSMVIHDAVDSNSDKVLGSVVHSASFYESTEEFPLILLQELAETSSHVSQEITQLLDTKVPLSTSVDKLSLGDIDTSTERLGALVQLLVHVPTVLFSKNERNRVFMWTYALYASLQRHHPQLATLCMAAANHLAQHSGVLTRMVSDERFLEPLLVVSPSYQAFTINQAFISKLVQYLAESHNTAVYTTMVRRLCETVMQGEHVEYACWLLSKCTTPFEESQLAKQAVLVCVQAVLDPSTPSSLRQAMLACITCLSSESDDIAERFLQSANRTHDVDMLVCSVHLYSKNSLPTLVSQLVAILPNVGMQHWHRIQQVLQTWPSPTESALLEAFDLLTANSSASVAFLLLTLVGMVTTTTWSALAKNVPRILACLTRCCHQSTLGCRHAIQTLHACIKHMSSGFRPPIYGLAFQLVQSTLQHPLTTDLFLDVTKCLQDMVQVHQEHIINSLPLLVNAIQPLLHAFTTPLHGTQYHKHALRGVDLTECALALVRLLERLSTYIPTTTGPFKDLLNATKRTTVYILVEYVTIASATTNEQIVTKDVDSILLRGMYALLDNCHESMLDATLALLDPNGKHVLKRLVHTYTTTFKYTGKA